MRATPEFDFGLSEQTLMLRDTVAALVDKPGSYAERSGSHLP